MLLRTYKTEHELAAAAGGMGKAVDEKTFRKWAWQFIDAIALLEPTTIKWKRRKKNDRLNDALVSIDGTDMHMQQLRPFWKGWYSFKFHGPGMRWEVAICILTGEIVWIHGPFPCGRWPDIEIFRHSLKSHLGRLEKGTTDDGYMGEPHKILCPRLSSKTRKDKEMRGIIRGRHETVNKRLKDWSCLAETCRHSILQHSSMFRAVAVLTNLAFLAGEPLFQVDYRDEEFSLCL